MDNPFTVTHDSDPSVFVSVVSNADKRLVYTFTFIDSDQNFEITFNNRIDTDRAEEIMKYILSCIRKFDVQDNSNDIRDNDVRQALSSFMILIEKVAKYFPEILEAQEVNVENKDTLEE